MRAVSVTRMFTPVDPTSQYCHIEELETSVWGLVGTNLIETIACIFKLVSISVYSMLNWFFGAEGVRGTFTSKQSSLLLDCLPAGDKEKI